jgi:hypothetical protein
MNITTSKKANIDGVIYDSAASAGRCLNIYKGTIIKRLESPFFENYNWYDKEMQEKVQAKWRKLLDKRKNKIKKPFPTRHIIIDNIEYESVSIASVKLNISKSKILCRINNPKFYNYSWFKNKQVYISIENLSFENICCHINRLMSLSKTKKVASIKNEPEIWNWIETQYKLKYTIKTKDITKVYLAIHPEEELICPYGNIKKLNSLEIGLSCTNSCKCTGERRVITFNKIYGVNSNLGLPAVRETIKETLNLLYKVDFVYQIPGIYEKIENKVEELFGEKNIANTEYFKNKFKETCNLRYERNNPKQRHISLESLKILSTAVEFAKLIPSHSMSSLAKYLGVGTALICNTYHEFGLEHINFISRRSNFEFEVSNFLKENNIQFKPDDRIQLKPLELDFYFAHKNIGIELQGTYWHMDPRKYQPTDFHKIYKMTAKEIWDRDEYKANLCITKNIELITIWESDWKINKDSIKIKLLEVLK